MLRNYIFILFLLTSCGQILTDNKFGTRPNRDQMYAPPGRTFYFAHSPKGWKNLPIPFKFGSSLSYESRIAILKAINLWENALGKKLFEYKGIDYFSGDDFNHIKEALYDDFLGFYAVTNWEKITGRGKDSIGTSIWRPHPYDFQAVGKGDIMFNFRDYSFENKDLDAWLHPNKIKADLTVVAAHEIGHELGFEHINQPSIMNATMATGGYKGRAFLNEVDIRNARLIYNSEEVESI